MSPRRLIVLVVATLVYCIVATIYGATIGFGSLGIARIAALIGTWVCWLGLLATLGKMMVSGNLPRAVVPVICAIGLLCAVLFHFLP